MSRRDEILAAIRQNTKVSHDYPTWEIKALTYPDKISSFCEICRFVGGEAVVLQPGETLDEVIRKYFPEARSIASSLKELTCATIRPDELETAQELDGTDVAVVEGDFGVVENGAVWIPQNIKLKALYFIADALAIVIDRHSLVNNMHEAYRRLAGQSYPFGTFISGPSKTADIEQALVMGAHGARTALVILR
ncbi:MAG: LUD domain-containing protein [Paraprevotella sp.]|nr:LUD domain-containing protein [Paraprevotella sp.]